MSRILVPLAVTLSLALSGCASTKGAQASDKRSDLSTLKVPSADASVLVIYRNVTGFMMGGAGMVNTTVLVDGQPVGDLPHDTYGIVELSPGKHTITARGMGESNLLVTTYPGSIQYVQMETSPAPKLLSKSSFAQREVETDCGFGWRQSLLPAAAPAPVVRPVTGA